MNGAFARIFRQGRLHRIPQCRFYADEVKPMHGIPQHTNHCTGLPPTNSYVLESRTLLIQKSIENLKSEKIKIRKPGVQIKINDKFQSKGTDGPSLFLYEKVPMLKYHNPDVPIMCTRDDSLPWEVKACIDDGEWIFVPIEGQSAEEILNNLSLLIDAEIEEDVIESVETVEKEENLIEVVIASQKV